MAGCPDALRGDGLAKVYRNPDGLEVDPPRLDDARVRLGHSPPSYISYSSDTTTRITSPNPLTEQQRWQLIRDRAASLPSEQFHAQKKEERERLWYADPRTSWMTQIPIEGSLALDETVHEKIKKSWADQGIWNNKWNERALGLWKHEEPLELESESETDSEADSPPYIFLQPPKPKKRRPKSEEEKQRIAERRVVREREREASRPYYQFIFQVSKRRDRIELESRSAEGKNDADINTRAYENVKNTWIERGIWNNKWGILPGMSWKHEEPIEEVTDDSPNAASALGNARMAHYEAVQAPTIRLFGSPSPVEPNYQESGIFNSPYGPSASVDSLGSENDDAEYTHPTSKSHYAMNNGHVPHSAMRQALRSRNRKPSPKNQPAAGEPLGPFHPPYVSEATQTYWPGPPQLYSPVQITADFPPSRFFNPTQRLPFPVTIVRHRSEQSGRPVSSEPDDLIRTTSPDSSTRTAGPTLERNSVNNRTARTSAKPRGILKRQSSRTTRRR